MPKRTDIHKILILGSGPIVIGQAAEFDYSGTQALKALRQAGYKLVVVNSNSATIMTDPELSDAVYVEPLTPEFVEAIIAKEQPDALLPTLGGQTALNLAVALSENGALERHGVALIGASFKAIQLAEDRELFKQTMLSIGLEVPRSRQVSSLREALETAAELGYPLIARPSFTLGGTGGGIAYNLEELTAIVNQALIESPTATVLLEESVIGWKEYEMEVMRDCADNALIVCSIENLDPMGVHTGDSITVAPAQTLTDREYQRMRDASLAVLRAIGVDTGGSNIQFAVNPADGRMVVIEMNPRVSRSSALASKATGYPIAKVAALLAVGYRLDEIANDITRRTTAAFEPTLDYVVVKMPRFQLEKFPGTDPRLNTQMKSVGEAMAIGRTFKEALGKAMRSLELDATPKLDFDRIPQYLASPTPERLSYVFAALRAGYTVDDIHGLTYIDRWFLTEMAQFVALETELRALPWDAVDRDALLQAKLWGFSDLELGELWGRSGEDVRRRRAALGVRPVFKMVDTCAAEFEAATPYFYSTYAGTENEATVLTASTDLTDGTDWKRGERVISSCGSVLAGAVGDRPEQEDFSSCGVLAGAVGDRPEQEDFSSCGSVLAGAVGDRPEQEDFSSCGVLAGAVGDRSEQEDFSSCGRSPDRATATHSRERVIILGSGPNRIGQGIEFDYANVHAVWALQEEGYEVIMVNSNPETVSTDYDTADRLYFEPLTAEDVLAIVENERPIGVVVTFGGQTPLKLARTLVDHGIPLLGMDYGMIEMAEDRKQFGALLDQLGLKSPPYGTAVTVDEALRVAESLGYPVLLRPSYVLGGRAMEIVANADELRHYITEATRVSAGHPVLIDRFLEDALELDVDILTDGEDVWVAGLMEQIEEAGVHSGDSACVLPPASLSERQIATVEDAAARLVLAMGAKGLVNLQMAIKGTQLYILEANPRASRTVPFVSKAIGVPLAKLAAKVLVGRKLCDLLANGKWQMANGESANQRISESANQRIGESATVPQSPSPLPSPVYRRANLRAPSTPLVSVKEVVLPFRRFPGSDVLLGPEMRSTGEVMSFGASFPEAFAKSQIAAGNPLPTSGAVLASLTDADKREGIALIGQLYDMGFAILATRGTAHALQAMGIPAEVVHKIGEGRPDCADVIAQGRVQLVVNTPSAARSEKRIFDAPLPASAAERGVPLPWQGARTAGYRIRAAALQYHIPYVTTLVALRTAVAAIRFLRHGTLPVRALGVV